jgi:hypothetical protein
MMYGGSSLVFEQEELVPLYRRILVEEHNFDPYAGLAKKPGFCHF